MKEQTLRILLLPLALGPIGFWIFASVVYMCALPIAIIEELSDPIGHWRRKDLWARLKEKRIS